MASWGRGFLLGGVGVCAFAAMSFSFPAAATDIKATSPALARARARANTMQTLLTRRVLENRRLHQQLLHRTSTIEALELAAATAGTASEQQAMFRTLYRIAACESTGTHPAPWPATTRVLDAHARNPHAEARSGEHAIGLLQFLPSTWRTTPYRGLKITSPYAQAMAAAWMIRHGRIGEWACAWSAR